MFHVKSLNKLLTSLLLFKAEILVSAWFTSFAVVVFCIR